MIKFKTNSKPNFKIKHPYSNLITSMLVGFVMFFVSVLSLGTGFFGFGNLSKASAYGSGTESSPYVVNTASDFSDNVIVTAMKNSNAYITLGANINLGSNMALNDNFKANLNGNGYTVTSSAAFVKNNEGTIYNVKFAYATDSFSYGAKVVSGDNLGTLNNLEILKTRENVNVSALKFGGFAAQNFGVITNAINNQHITATANNTTGIGGIVGVNYNKIISVANFGNVTITGLKTSNSDTLGVAGGIVGINTNNVTAYNNEIKNVYNTGNVTSSNGTTENGKGVRGAHAGGIVGVNSVETANVAVINSVINYGNVTAGNGGKGANGAGGNAGTTTTPGQGGAGGYGGGAGGNAGGIVGYVVKASSLNVTNTVNHGTVFAGYGGDGGYGGGGGGGSQKLTTSSTSASVLILDEATKGIGTAGGQGMIVKANVSEFTTVYGSGGGGGAGGGGASGQASATINTTLGANGGDGTAGAAGTTTSGGGAGLNGIHNGSAHILPIIGTSGNYGLEVGFEYKKVPVEEGNILTNATGGTGGVPGAGGNAKILYSNNNYSNNKTNYNGFSFVEDSAWVMGSERPHLRFENKETFVSVKFEVHYNGNNVTAQSQNYVTLQTNLNGGNASLTNGVWADYTNPVISGNQAVWVSNNTNFNLSALHNHTYTLVGQGIEIHSENKDANNFVTSSVLSILENANRSNTNNVVTIKINVEDKAYNIQYITYGGTNHIDNPAVYTAESTTITLKPAVKNGYTFEGWFTNENFTGSAVTQIVSGATGGITLHAKFTATPYTITYVLDGGTNHVSNPTTYTIESATITLGNATREGYNFVGWSEGNTIVSGSTGNKTFTAMWQIKTFTVSLPTHAGYDIVLVNTSSSLVNFNGDFSFVVNLKPAYADSDIVVKANGQMLSTVNDIYTITNITQNVVVEITNVSINNYTVEFKGNGGTLVNGNAIQTVAYGDAATAPVFEKVGYEFDGWNVAFNNITANTVVTALWKVKTYTVTFVANGGTLVSGQTVQTIEHGGYATAPVVEKNGYEFDGWNVNFENVVSNLTVTAQWKIINYTITYHADGGTHANPTTYTIETPDFTLQDAEKETATFMGWYNNAEFNGNKITSVVKGTIGNLNLYARFVSDIYNVNIKIVEEGTGKTQTGATLTYGAVLVNGQVYNSNTLNFELSKGTNTITLLTGHHNSQVAGAQQSKGIYLLNTALSTLPLNYTLSGDVMDAEGYHIRMGEPTLYNAVNYATLTFNLQSHLVEDNSIVLHYSQLKALPTYENFTGEGTVNNPYIIRNINDLSKLSEIFNNNPSSAYTGGKYYEFYSFDNTIENSYLGTYKAYINPIGTKDSPFDGIVLAKGRAIKNLIIETDEFEAVGLFGYLAQNAEIHNLILENASIINNFVGTHETLNGTDIYNAYTGAIAGVNAGIITKSAVTYITGASQGAIVSDNFSYVGGIAGKNIGEIINSYNHYDITGGYIAGGIVGVNFGKIDGSYNLGKVTATYASGIAGRNGTGVFTQDNVITNSYNAGQLIGATSVAGITHNFNKDSGKPAQDVLTNSYFLNTTSEAAYINVGEIGLTSDAGFGKLTEAELKNAESLSEWFTDAITYYALVELTASPDDAYATLKQRNFGYPLLVNIGNTINVKIVATLNGESIDDLNALNNDWKTHRPFNQAFEVSAHLQFRMYVEKVNESSEFYILNIRSNGAGTLIPGVVNSSVTAQTSYNFQDYTVEINFAYNTVSTAFLNEELVTGEENGQFNVSYNIDKSFTFTVNKPNLFVSTLQVFDGTTYVNVNNATISGTPQVKEINNSYGYIRITVKTSGVNDVEVTVVTRGVNVKLRVIISANVTFTATNASFGEELNTIRILRNGTEVVFEAQSNTTYNFSLPLGEFNANNEAVLYTYSLRVSRTENANILSKLFVNGALKYENIFDAETGYDKATYTTPVDLVNEHTFTAEFIRTEVYINIIINKDYAGYIEGNLSFDIKAENAVNATGEVMNVNSIILTESNVVLTFAFNYNSQTKLSINTGAYNNQIFNAGGGNYYRPIWFIGSGDNLMVNALNENYNFTNNVNLEFVMNEPLMADVNVTLYLVRLITISTYADLHSTSLHTTVNPDIMPIADIDESSITHKTIANGKTLPGAVLTEKLAVDPDIDKGHYIQFADINTSFKFTVSREHLKDSANNDFYYNRFEFMQWVHDEYEDYARQVTETDYEVSEIISNLTVRALYKLQEITVYVTRINHFTYSEGNTAKITINGLELVREGANYTYDGKVLIKNVQRYMDDFPSYMGGRYQAYVVAVGEEIKITGAQVANPSYDNKIQRLKIIEPYSVVNGNLHEDYTDAFKAVQLFYDGDGYKLGVTGKVYADTLIDLEYYSLARINYGISSGTTDYITTVSEIAGSEKAESFVDERLQLNVTDPNEEITYDLSGENAKQNVFNGNSKVVVKFYMGDVNGYNLNGYNLTGWRVQMPYFGFGGTGTSITHTITETTNYYDTLYTVNKTPDENGYVTLEFEINLIKNPTLEQTSFMFFIIRPMFKEKTTIVTLNVNPEDAASITVGERYDLFTEDTKDVILGGEDLADNQYVAGYYAKHIIRVTKNTGYNFAAGSGWYSLNAGEFSVTAYNVNAKIKRLDVNEYKFDQSHGETHNITFNFTVA